MEVFDKQAILDELMPVWRDRVERAANHLASVLKTTIPRSKKPGKLGHTADRIRVLMVNTEPRAKVIVPYPWAFNELGHVTRGGRYIPPRPIARQTLLSEKDTLESYLRGDLD